MATLLTLRTDLFNKLKDTAGNPVSTTQATTLLNDALLAWVNATKELRLEDAIAMTADQFDYAAHANLMQLLSAHYRGNLGAHIEIVNITELGLLGGYEYNASGFPQYISIDGLPDNYRLRLYPAPSSTSNTSPLNGAINSTVTTITVDDATKFRERAGWVKINDEKILYQQIDTVNNQLKLCRRGVGDTTAASHLDNDTVTMLDFHYVFAKRPNTLSADGDVPEIDARWHKYLVYHALAEALRLNGRVNEAQAAEGKWFAGLIEAKRSVRIEQGGSPSAILWGGY